MVANKRATHKNATKKMRKHELALNATKGKQRYQWLEHARHAQCNNKQTKKQIKSREQETMPPAKTLFRNCEVENT